METILIQVSNPKAYQLLLDLEALNLIKIVGQMTGESAKPSERYRGKLPPAIADALQNYVSESR